MAALNSGARSLRSRAAKPSTAPFCSALHRVVGRVVEREAHAVEREGVLLTFRALAVDRRGAQIDLVDVHAVGGVQRFKLIRSRANRRQVEGMIGDLRGGRAAQGVFRQNADLQAVEEVAERLRQP